MRQFIFALAHLFISASVSAQVQVTDFAGREIRLPSPAQRIVALAPHVVENVFTAGAGSKLVGAVSYSDYPAPARNINRVGSYEAWSVEAIVEADPDLVIMWGSGNGPGKLGTLLRLGFPVYISEPRRLQDIPRAIRDIGSLAGTTDTSEQQALAMEQQIQTLRHRYSRAEPASVFYQVWHNPLQTVNGNHMISDVIRLCGGENIFSDTDYLAPKISLESVLARDPQVIVASGMDEARPEWLDDWKSYSHLTAVRNNALLFVHPDLLQRPTARILLGAQSLCEQMTELR